MVVRYNLPQAENCHLQMYTHTHTYTHRYISPRPQTVLNFSEILTSEIIKLIYFSLSRRGNTRQSACGKTKCTCTVFKANYQVLRNMLCFQWICVIDRLNCMIVGSVVSASIDRASIDRSRCAIDGLSCTIDHPWPSIDACTVRHLDD